MVGAFLSALFPEIGPAVVQFPAVSQTERLAVVAFAVSVSAGMLVVSENDASAGFASPLSVSLAVHPIDTSDPCHIPSAVPHVTAGGILSTRARSQSVPCTHPVAVRLRPTTLPASLTAVALAKVS